MLKILSKLLILLYVAMPFMSSAHGITFIGYCDGEVTESSSIGDNRGNQLIEAAAIFPASMFEAYDDLEIMGINAGLASRLNISEITVWVRESLEGENLFQAVLHKEDGIKKGWNRIMGKNTILPKGKDMYVGYSLVLTGASFPISAVGSDHEGGLLVNTDGEWVDMSDAGFGVLSIELIATASNLIEYDLTLRQVTLPESIKIGSTVPLGLKILNNGTNDVSAFQIECSVKGYEPIIFDIEQEIKSNEYADIEIDFTSPVNLKSYNVIMKVSILSIRDGEDSNLSDNEMYATFDMHRIDFNKNLLIEEFSTENCTYCPRGAAVLHDLLSEPEYEGKILAVVHHVGFGTDWLTIPASNNYLWFYGGGTGSTYAPAFMYDRCSFDGDSPVNEATEDYSIIKTKVTNRLSMHCMAALEAIAEYDSESSFLNIHVTGERKEGYTGNRLTICVVENEIAALHQAGANGPFTHQHVLRDVNEIWGDMIEWNDEDGFNYDTSLYINPSWVKENLEVIAFISEYNPNNYKDCAIDNAVAAAINWNSAEVDRISSDDEVAQPEYFSLQGLKVKHPKCGIYLVKRGNKITKEYIK